MQVFCPDKGNGQIVCQLPLPLDHLLNSVYREQISKYSNKIYCSAIAMLQKQLIKGKPDFANYSLTLINVQTLRQHRCTIGETLQKAEKALLPVNTTHKK